MIWLSSWLLFFIFWFQLATLDGTSSKHGFQTHHALWQNWICIWRTKRICNFKLTLTKNLNIACVCETGEGHVNTQRRLQSSARVGFEPTIYGSTGRRFTDWANSPPLEVDMRNITEQKRIVITSSCWERKAWCFLESIYQSHSGMF